MPKAVYHSDFCDTHKLSMVRFNPRISRTNYMLPCMLPLEAG